MDPSISLADYDSNLDKVLYNENSVTTNLENHANDGVNVYIRWKLFVIGLESNVSQSSTNGSNNGALAIDNDEVNTCSETNTGLKNFIQF